MVAMLSTRCFHCGFLFSWDGRFLIHIMAISPSFWWVSSYLLGVECCGSFQTVPFGFTGAFCFFYFIYNGVCFSVGSPFHWAFFLSMGILFLLSKYVPYCGR